MLTSLPIFWILLLVYSVAVALPKKTEALKRAQSKHYGEDFVLSSDESSYSEENVPVKFGRRIYPLARSTEDMNEESSEENILNDRPIGREDIGQSRWSLSSVLRSPLNFVNKLRREYFFSKKGKTERKDVPKYTGKNINEDIYLQSFKKWLRKNKILNNDDSISSYVLDNDFYFNDYNLESYQPRRKSYKNSKTSRNKKLRFNDKRNRVKNSKSNINNHYQPQTLKGNYHGVSVAETFDQGSKAWSTLYDTNQYNAYDDEKYDSCESLEKNEHTDMATMSNNHKRVKVKENSSMHLEGEDSNDNTSTEIAKSKTDRQILESHHNSKSTEKIHPKTRTMTTQVSDSFDLDPKQQKSVPFPQKQSETSLKVSTLEPYGTHPSKSDVNIASKKNPNKQVVKLTQPKDGQKTLQQSLTSSVEQLGDKGMVKQAKEDTEQRKKSNTFLEYIYKHSNSSYFQSLRKTPSIKLGITVM